VLNRLYIVIGIIAILILAAAFIVPSLVPWGSYRGRMETLASRALGADVRINGDIRFSLLPAPHLELSDVAVGPAKQPTISVKSADADFSLIDFLRDRYTMTRLVLDHPVLDLKVAADGTVDTGLNLPSADSQTNLSAANARIAVGTVNVLDAASGREYVLDGIDGDLAISALGGPFGFTGGGSAGGQHYSFHVTTSALDSGGKTQLSLFAQPDGNAFSVNLQGPLETAGAPHFTGDLSYRQSPAGGKDSNGVIGDLTLTGKVDATPQKIALGDFTLIPDENRAVTRVTGSATIDLGKAPSFTASLSSGVLAMSPRDATAEQQGPQPYELVRMLSELPIVPVPGIAGTISADISELDLRSLTLSNVKLVAASDTKEWAITQFSGQLPGNATIKLAGDLGAPDGRPSFSGTLAIDAPRLDTLATLWRKPAADNPLFNMPGGFQSKVALVGPTMALTDGQLTVDGTTHLLTALINFGGPERRIDLSGQFKDLSAEDSAALLALVPDLEQDPSAAATFPQGALSLTADSATLFGLKGTTLEVEGKWGHGSVELSKFAAVDLGGAGLNLSLALSGTMAEPRVAGDGRITLGAGGGPVLDKVFDLFGTPAPVRTLLARSLPVDLKAHLDDPKDSGAQGLSLSGKAGVADMTLVAQLDGGLPHALAAPISANLDMQSGDAKGLTSQFGLGDISILPDNGLTKLSATLDGSPTGTMKANLAVDGGGDSIGFEGNVTPGDLSAITGSGKLTLALSDTSVLADDLGIAGLNTPPVKGSGDLRFEAGRSIALDNIAASSGVSGFAGNLALNYDARGAVVSGGLSLDKIDVAALVAAAGGPTALMTSAGKIWPDGPIAAGDAPRVTTGSIAIKAPSLTLGGQPFVADAGFDFDWDATHVGVQNFNGKLGGGTLAFGVDVCCAGQIADKQITGSASLKGVAASALLPVAAAATVSGTVDGSGRFDGTGDSLDAVLGDLSGDGSFSLSDLKVQKFDPDVFASIAGISDIVDLDANDLTAKVADGLDQGPFGVPQISGGLLIAGGIVRASNLAAATPAARLFGGTTLKLSDLSLGGGFSLTPIGTLDKAGIVSETTAKVTANLSGTLAAPTRTLDIASMVDAIKVKALEVEVARLEALKQADDARTKAAAAANKEATEDEAAKQLADQQAAQAAADAAAKQAAADEAAKKAADAAAKQAAADEAAKAAAAKKAAQEAAAKATPPPLDLQLPQAPFF